MALSCFLTALGGTFLAQLTLYIYPKQILGLDFYSSLHLSLLSAGAAPLPDR